MKYPKQPGTGPPGERCGNYAFLEAKKGQKRRRLKCGVARVKRNDVVTEQEARARTCRENRDSRGFIAARRKVRAAHRNGQSTDIKARSPACFLWWPAGESPGCSQFLRPPGWNDAKMSSDSTMTEAAGDYWESVGEMTKAWLCRNQTTRVMVHLIPF